MNGTSAPTPGGNPTAPPLARTRPLASTHWPPRPAQAPRTTPSTLAPKRLGLGSWMLHHKVLVSLLGLALVGASVGVATLLIRQDVVTNPSTVNAVLKFQNGSDYTSINAANFATLTIPASGSSATMALTGVSGAALTTLGNVLAINNTASSTDYTETLTRSTTLNSAISSFTVTVKDGASTLVTWDAKSAASSSSYTHTHGHVLNITVDLVVADGTSAGGLGSFDIQFSFVPI